jgi:hypothetical protein
VWQIWGNPIIGQMHVTLFYRPMENCD